MNTAYIKQTLKDGYNNGSFTKEQIVIFSLNYLIKGIFTQSDFDDMDLFLNPEEEEYENPD